MLTSPGDLLPPGPDSSCVLSDEDDFCQKAGICKDILFYFWGFFAFGLK